MEVKGITPTAYLYYRRKQRYKGNYWMHPLLSSRLTKGMFITFIRELRSYKEKFSLKSIDELLDTIKPNYWH
jgi:hypothetical protein